VSSNQWPFPNHSSTRNLSRPLKAICSPSILSLLGSVQAANVVPVIAMLRGPEVVHLESIIWALLLGGVVVSQLMSFCWAATTPIPGAGGKSHALSLILLTFLAGCINNSSSLFLYPFVARWERRYVSALATGEGLSGILVSLIGLTQNVGGARPRFSVRAYFQGVSALYVFSLLGFLFLLQEERRKKARVALSMDRVVAEERETAWQGGAKKRVLLSVKDEDSDALDVPLSAPTLAPAPVLALIWPFLLAQFGISLWAYGVIPALTPISTSGYQHAAHVLQYSSIVSMALDPLSRALTHRLRCYRLPLLVVLVNVLAAVLCVAAAISPRPPFVDQPLGGLFVVFFNGAFTAAFAFTSTMVFFCIHRALGPRHGLPLPVHARRAGGADEAPGLQEDACALMVGQRRGGGRPVSIGRGEGEGEHAGEVGPGGKEEFVQVLRRQDGFRWSGFIVQVGAFVGALATFLLVA